MTHHVPAVHSVIFTLTKILLIMSCFDTVPGGADAYKIPPRFSRPASFYFQMNPEGYPQFGYNPWADKRKLEWLMNEINSIRANLSSEWTKRKDEQIVSVSLDNSDKTRSPCNQLDPAELRECNGEEKRDEKSAKKQQITEVTKRIVIENYKRRILRQMNLSEPPQISRPEVNDSTWTSLPKILQYRLKAEIDSANQVIEDPVKEDEEKETFILVQPFPFHLKRMASSTFTIKIAEEIDPRHISYAVVHTEQAGDLPVGSELSLWEIIPPWPGVAQSPHGETYFDDGPVYSEMNSTPSSSDEDPQENLPELDSEQSAVPPSFDAASSHLFKLIRPQIASAVVRENQDATSIEFDVTARLIHWLKYRSKRNSKSSLIRHVLIVCANCADRANPIDSQKFLVVDAAETSGPAVDRKPSNKAGMDVVMHKRHFAIPRSYYTRGTPKRPDLEVLVLSIDGALFPEKKLCISVSSGPNSDVDKQLDRPYLLLCCDMLLAKQLNFPETSSSM
ncbi:unnamed protein product [Calicophoron daubneyi]|uniref:Uncharacterized protein n=1 Tax=Calicophoron daubneyi TaxID=300641 RepID=A0AAV2SZG8_CALDB